MIMFGRCRVRMFTVVVVIFVCSEVNCSPNDSKFHCDEHTHRTTCAEKCAPMHGFTVVCEFVKGRHAGERTTTTPVDLQPHQKTPEYQAEYAEYWRKQKEYHGDWFLLVAGYYDHPQRQMDNAHDEYVNIDHCVCKRHRSS